MDHRIQKAIQKAISSHEPAANPAFIINPNNGAFERHDPRPKVVIAKGHKAEPEKKTTYHKKGSLQSRNNLSGYDTFSLAAIWPQNPNQ